MPFGDANNFVAPEGDGWVVYVNGQRYGPYASQSEAENAYNQASGGGGGAGPTDPNAAYLEAYLGNIAQQNAYQQAQQAAEMAYRNAQLAGANEAQARNAAISAGSNALSSYVSLLNAYGGGAGLDANALAEFIRSGGTSGLNLPTGPTLEREKYELQKRMAEAELQANPRDIFKLAAYTGGGGAPAGGGALSQAAQAAGVTGTGGGLPTGQTGGGLPPGYDGEMPRPGLPPQGFTRFVRGGQGGNMSPEAQRLYGQTADGRWVAFENPQQFFQAAGVGSFEEAWQKGLIENRNGEVSGQGIFNPEGWVPFSQYTPTNPPQPGGGGQSWVGGTPPSPPLPPGEPVNYVSSAGGSASGYDPRLYNVPFYQQLRQYGSSNQFPFNPQVPLPQPNAIPLGFYTQQSPFNQGLLEAAYSTAGLSEDVLRQPFKQASQSFGGTGTPTSSGY